METTPFVVRIWVVASSLIVAAGWILSAFHQLNAAGYICFFLLVALAVAWGWNRLGLAQSFGRGCRRFFQWRRLRWRFSRRLPLAFLVLALLAIVGGVLHPPNNYDALNYRLPRMLNWVAQEQWHWIHTPNPRQNDRACGFEWLTMPLLVLTKSDRGFFLINGVSFLLLPGLVFSVFTRLGVRRRVAWNWMWLLPSGYTFVLQAGSMANDMFAAPYALAALDLALRAWRSKRPSDAWLSVLAVGLMTGAKALNLALLLPLAAALAPSWRLLLAKPVGTAGVTLLAALVSFLPNAILNYKYCGDWSGEVLEIGRRDTVLWVSIVGNVALLFMQNLAPPILPAAQWWTRHGAEFFPAEFRELFQSNFESQGLVKLTEIQVEDTAGLGFGLCVLLLVSLGWICRCRLKEGPARPILRTGITFPPWYTRILLCLPLVSLLAYMIKMQLWGAGRLITAYYPLLVPLVLWPARLERLVRRRWWERAVLVAFALAAFPVIANPGRPLFPAKSFFAALNLRLPGHHLLERAQLVYTVYEQRKDALAPVRNLIPSGVSRIGYASTGEAPESSLWRPFGSRFVVNVLAKDTVANLRRDQIQYVVLSPGLTNHFQMPLTVWLQQFDAELVGQVNLRPLASQPPETWYLAKLRPAATANMDKAK